MSVTRPTNSSQPRFTLINRVSNRWKKWITPRSTDREEAFRERTIRAAIPICAIFLLLVVIEELFLFNYSILDFIIPQGFFTLFLLGSYLAVVRRRLVPAGYFLLFIWILGTFVSMQMWGYESPMSIFSPIFAVVFAALILPRSHVIRVTIIMLVFFTANTLWQSIGDIAPMVPRDLDPMASPLGVIMAATTFVSLIMAMGYYALNELDARLVEVNELVEMLEIRVAERTRDLQVAADVSKRVTTILDLHDLLPDIVERTRTGFDLYHAAVFLYDDDTRILSYAAGTGEAGQVMKASNKHFLLDDESGMVPRAARTHEAMLTNDVAQSQDYFANSYLPETRAELALPMLVGGELIGVLDLQSKLVNRFSEDDLRVMTSLAEQLAVAVQNARLYAEQVKVAEELRSLDNMKSQFLASMSHELRTPLNAILNFTEFVSLGMLGPINEKQVDALNKSLDSGRHLLSLINDVLDMTKIESGKLRLFIENNIDLQKELAAVTATAETLLKDKPVAFVPDVDEDLPTIVGDRRRIRQVLLNLISNAAKFTEEGSVTLSVKTRAKEMLFAVIDTGPGIALEDQELIFEPFQQTETGIQHAAGTGLGLPISKRLAEAHGGRLWLESEPGEGAAFYISLPIKSDQLLELMSETE